MSNLSLNHLKNLSGELKEKIPDLKMLILFGSRARGNTHSKSDWDFAILSGESLNYLEIYGILADIFKISDDKIDLVNFKNSSPLLDYHIAKDGKVIYEHQPEEFIKFQMKACKIYADTVKFRELQKQNIKVWLEKMGV